jgi:hypothetical protein
MDERKNVMRTLPALLILAVAVAVMSPMPTSRAEEPQHNVAQQNVHDSENSHTDHGTPCSHDHGAGTHPLQHAAGSHDHVALEDMHKFASHELHSARCLLHTYGTAPHWSPDWELRWVDYDAGDRIVRIYHVTNKHDGVRRVSLLDSARLHDHAWNPAH